MTQTVSKLWYWLYIMQTKLERWQIVQIVHATRIYSKNATGQLLLRYPYQPICHNSFLLMNIFLQKKHKKFVIIYYFFRLF